MMRAVRKVWLGAALFGLALNVSADEDGYSAAYDTCMEASGGVTVNMLDCMASETKLQDARLNQNYKAAMKALEPPLQSQLQEAQRLWIKFRDADCGLLGSLTGGTMDSINLASCHLDMTKKRADDLAGLVEQGQL